MTTGGRILNPIAEPLLNNAGLPDVGATMQVYISGGSTPASLFADAALSTPIPNPLTSNAAGRFYGAGNTYTEWWADDSQAYDIVVTFSEGGDLTYDNVYTLGPATNVSGFAPINSPIFTGTPQAPTPATNDNSAKIATTAYVQAQNYAALASPGFSGVPTAPTASSGTNTTQLATTAFVTAAVKSAAQSIGSNGYVTLPGGLIVQFGHYASSISGETSTTITFPTTFPTACLGAISTGVNTGASVNKDMWTQTVSISTTQVVFFSQANGGVLSLDGLYWIAWGN